MGVDIHMFVVKDKQILVDVATKVFNNFRNYDWFDNICGNGYNNVYNTFPFKYGISPQAPKKGEFKDCQEWGYDFLYINVGDFKQWFHEYRPDIDAGWITTYEKWQYEKHGTIPEDFSHNLPLDANINDMHFVEVINHGEPSVELFNYLIENQIDDSADITYWFDH